MDREEPQTDESAELERLKSRTLAAAARNDIRIRRRHRVGALVAVLTTGALVTAGTVVFGPPPPPPPLPHSESVRLYEASVEAAWQDLVGDFPEAERPDARFVRFVSRGEQATVIRDCLVDRGIPATVDEYGTSTTVPRGSELQYRLGWFACDTMYPRDPSDQQAYTWAEQHYIFDYFAGPLTDCLKSRGYPIAPAPTFDEFAARWWGDDPWSPYRNLAETDGDRFAATRDACPPMPTDLR